MRRKGVLIFRVHIHTVLDYKTIPNILAAYTLTSAHPSFFNEHLLYPFVPYCTQIHSLESMNWFGAHDRN